MTRLPWGRSHEPQGDRPCFLHVPINALLSPLQRASSELGRPGLTLGPRASANPPPVCHGPLPADPPCQHAPRGSQSSSHGPCGASLKVPRHPPVTPTTIRGAVLTLSSQPDRAGSDGLRDPVPGPRAQLVPNKPAPPAPLPAGLSSRAPPFSATIAPSSVDHAETLSHPGAPAGDQILQRHRP